MRSTFGKVSPWAVAGGDDLASRLHHSVAGPGVLQAGPEGGGGAWVPICVHDVPETPPGSPNRHLVAIASAAPRATASCSIGTSRSPTLAVEWSAEGGEPGGHNEIGIRPGGGGHTSGQCRGRHLVVGEQDERSVEDGDLLRRAGVDAQL